jgi:hypothetical protein
MILYSHSLNHRRCGNFKSHNPASKRYKKRVMTKIRYFPRRAQSRRIFHYTRHCLCGNRSLCGADSGSEGKSNLRSAAHCNDVSLVVTSPDLFLLHPDHAIYFTHRHTHNLGYRFAAQSQPIDKDYSVFAGLFSVATGAVTFPKQNSQKSAYKHTFKTS